MQEKVSWVEKFVRVGAGPIDAARSEHDRYAYGLAECAFRCVL